MASFIKESAPSDTPKIQKHQNIKHLSKKAGHSGLRRSSVTPNLAAGGYQSHLCSLTYLSGHLKNFDPPSYISTPVRNPLPSGTGLCFNTLPQKQPFLKPPPDSKPFSLMDSDRVTERDPLFRRVFIPQSQNKYQIPLTSEEANSNIVGSSAHRIKPVIPPLSSAPASKSNKKRVKKILKMSNIPPPPLPSPKPTSQRRPRPRPANRVCPSQVAMASFIKESTPSDTLKSIAQEGSAPAVTWNGRKSGKRTFSKYPPYKHTQVSTSHAQPPQTSCKMDQPLVNSISSTKRESRSVGIAGNMYQTDQEVQLSPRVIPVSVPVSSKEAPINKTSGNTIQKHQNIKHLSKKAGHSGLFSNLITPNLAVGAYQSQPHSPTYLTVHLQNFAPPLYTPPPMLSPIQHGTGLYFNTLPRIQPFLPSPTILSTRLDGKDGISLISDYTVVSIKPKINVGSRFQAEIPELCNPLHIMFDEHPAQLVWAPWGDLPTNPKTQQKVTEFLDMCCSSVLPGGGTNTELALHCLHEVQGNILAALNLLLIRGAYRTSCHPLSDYHYTGSDHWTATEKRLFHKTLLNHAKDFQLIHKVLQTKSVAQCVEYYYTMKVKKFRQQCRRTEDTNEASKHFGFHKTSSRGVYTKTHQQEKRKRLSSGVHSMSQ